ncbi:MAG: ATP-binding cassette domain-containing protein [Thermotaleaceae bacterium]
MDIVLENVTKFYEQKQVLNVSNLYIPKGTCCGIIGPNGAGKSTLAKIIAGLEEPTTGEIYYGGEALKKVQENITLVFQKPYLLRTTVWKNIAYPLKLRGLQPEKIRHQVEAMIEEMGLQTIAHQKSWTLSGGEAQKVALARALIFKPRLLILDEPTANIDPRAVEVMERMIRRVHEEDKTTVLLVTHQLQQARRLCTEAVFMHQGKLEETGEIEKLIFKPDSKITQKFIRGELLID